MKTSKDKYVLQNTKENKRLGHWRKVKDKSLLNKTTKYKCKSKEDKETWMNTKENKEIQRFI